MDLSSTRTKIEDLLPLVEKPARYIGGETGSVVKSDASCRVVLSYPDVYEIGTANQAVQILYSLVNEHTSAWAQRVYCPWPDMAALMRERGVPLFALESWEPVRSADLWGITMQFELTYTNILEMLDLAGVPLDRSQRGEDDPLVFGGGPCASNPHPMSRFFDFFFLGDGEAVVPQLLAAWEECRALPRRERIERLSRLEGVWAPDFPAAVTRVVEPELKYDMIPLRPVVPSMHSVHDRATLEVMRGCTRGCRFCMAGNWYRPVRERPGADSCRAVAEIVANTGYEEASLSSLSTTDYSAVGDVLTGLAGSHPGLAVSLPSLRVDSDVFRLLVLSPIRKGSLTLAPEAGSQRLRDVINKQVTDDDIEKALTEAFRLGCTTVKLYFMIGLPTETEEDLQGIIDIAVQARRIGRQVSHNPGRVQVNISVASFVPKAHTPFQWEGMVSRTELAARQAFVRRQMPRKQIRLSMHDLEPSLVEGAIARGSGRTGLAIEEAWRAGARFDAWSECFDFNAWQAGFKAIGTSVEAEAERSFDPDEPLPWDDVDPRVSRQFLLEEHEKAMRGETTPDCRWDDCSLCGVCEGEIQMQVGER